MSLYRKGLGTGPKPLFKSGGSDSGPSTGMIVLGVVGGMIVLDKIGEARAKSLPSFHGSRPGDVLRRTMKPRERKF